MFIHEVHMQPNPTKFERPPKREPTQNIHASQIADALLKIQTVTAVTGLSESSIRRKMAAGLFPMPIKDGARCTRWVAGSVTTWLRAKAVAQ